MEEDNADEKASQDTDSYTLDRSSNHAEVMYKLDEQYAVDHESTPAESRGDQQGIMLQPEQQCKRRSSRATSTVFTEPPT